MQTVGEKIKHINNWKWFPSIFVTITRSQLQESRLLFEIKTTNLVKRVSENINKTKNHG